MKIEKWLGAVTLMLSAGLAPAADLPEVDTPWSRATPPGARVAGGFMQIYNNTDQDFTLVGGSVDFAGRVEVHTMAMEGEVMRMRKLEDGLEIPAGESVMLKPGGFHIMFMELQEGLVEGEDRSVTLHFDGGLSMDIEMEVRTFDFMPEGAMNGGHMMQHGNMQSGDMQHGEMQEGEMQHQSGDGMQRHDMKNHGDTSSQ